MARMRIVLLALLGLALTVGVTYAASELSSQTIGLSAEPPSAGDDLAPEAIAAPEPTATPRRPRPEPTPTAVPGDEGDDDGGKGRGRGRGRGGDDD